MSTVTAKLAAAKLDVALGITEEHAQRLHKKLGTRLVAVVELEAAERTENTKGKPVVKLAVTHLEVAADKATQDHLRDLARAIYRARTPTQLDLESTFDDVEPHRDEIIRRGKNTLEVLQGGS